MTSSRRVIRVTCLIVSCILLAFLIKTSFFDVSSLAEENDFSIISADKDIVVSWESDNLCLTDFVLIRISDETTSPLCCDRIPAVLGGYHFKRGVHGSLYNICISVCKKDGFEYSIKEENRLFLDYSKLPSIPMISISTYRGIEPTYDVVKDEVGHSQIVNTEFVKGDLVYSQKGEKTISSEVEIRCRGNSSLLIDEKKSYKIKTKEKCCFFDDDNKGYTEYILLKYGTSLKTFIGNYVGKECGMEWNPDAKFVNIMLNGDWKGIYYLTKSVGKESADDLVGDDGFIIENDAYYWKYDTYYFNTTEQNANQGFTFKYPSTKKVSEERINSIQKYMQNVEDSIISNEGYQEYIDEDSFVSWILARDILCVQDGLGSNQYYYKYSVNDDSKLKMGPLWDWDGMGGKDKWSECRQFSYSPWLFNNSEFEKKYEEKYYSISDNLLPNLREEFMKLCENQGEAINESRILDSSRWGVTVLGLEAEVKERSDWFSERIQWMNKYVGYDFKTKLEMINSDSFQLNECELDMVIESQLIDADIICFSGVYTDNGALMSENSAIGIITSNGSIYLAKNIFVQNNGHVSTYYFDIQTPIHGQVCLIDFYNQIIYKNKLDYISLNDEAFSVGYVGIFTSIDSDHYEKGTRIIEGIAYTEDVNIDSYGMIWGLDVDGLVYLSHRERKDNTWYKEIYDWKYDNILFSIRCPGDGKICLVDTVNHIVYEQP